MSAPAVLPSPAAAQPPQRRNRRIPPLENGDHLTATEFLRRYEAMPEVKKAELINGIVHMASPLRADQHGDPDFLMQSRLGAYAMRTPGVTGSSNATVRLGPDDVPQPDISLRLLPECGGRSRVGPDGLLYGAPELVIEIAASSVSIDTREKFHAYRRSGVQEYIVWRVEDEAVDWWHLVDDDYLPLPASDDGILRSRLFPGLWLNPDALLNEDGARLLETLHAGMESEEYKTFAASLKERMAVA